MPAEEGRTPARAPAVSELVCRGCGAKIEAGAAYPFRCPNAGGDDADHVLRRRLDVEALGRRGEAFSVTEPNPFLAFAPLLHAYQAARRSGLSDADWRVMVTTLDEAVARVDGGGFRTTPFDAVPALAARLGVAAAWVKDESGNVSGSHKGRHLMGVMLWLEAAERLGLLPPGELPPLAIASCGNAALAAAVVARAAERRLEVFVPTHANPRVLERLAALEAHLHACPRRAGESGDPCYLRFREAVIDGAIPFTCQGNENGLTLDGGKTLAWEMAATLAREDGVVDRLFLHVGGGALASSVIDGLREARDLGSLPRLPQIHAVQTEGAYPLARAYRRLAEHILERWVEGGGTAPASTEDRAALFASEELGPLVERGLEYAATHRSEFMWPWEEEPHSIADGILDDETYDWLAVVEGMLETGGWPIVVDEATLEEANRLAREATGMTPCHTGTAGLAGALSLSRAGALDPSESIGLLVTGIERG